MNSSGQDNERVIEVFSNYKIRGEENKMSRKFIRACMNDTCSQLAAEFADNLDRSEPRDVITNINSNTATPNLIKTDGTRLSDDLFTDYRREFSDDKSIWKNYRKDNSTIGFKSSFSIVSVQDLYAEPAEEIRLKLVSTSSDILFDDSQEFLTIPLVDSAPQLSISV